MTASRLSSADDPQWRQLSSGLGSALFVSGVNSGKAKCEKGWNWKPQPLLDYDLWYVAAGEGAMTIAGETFPIAPGSCFLLRPGDDIFAEQHPDRRLTVLFVHFRAESASGSADDGIARAEAALRLLPRRLVIRDTAWFESLLNRLLTLNEEERTLAADAEFDVVLKAALLVLLREAAADRPHPGRRHPAVRQAIRLMKENAASPLTREELAALTGTSARYLNVLFKADTGYSIKTYIARVRIERACQLLAESTMNVSQIADTLGYADIYFFSKQFKQFMGESPSSYRSRSHEPRRHR